MKKKNKLSPSILVIILFILVIPPVNFNHHKYSRGEEGVITWDIKSYYAYLPAAFIQKDLTLGFMDEDLKKWGKWIWPVTTPTGEKCILTSMGLSVMYSPFFFIAHGYASISDKYEADGYSLPYHVALTFSAYFYLLLALFFLRKLLLKYFSEYATAFTMIAVVVGTNLFFYSTYEAPMSHMYNFTLITILIYLTDKWWEKKNTWGFTLAIGLLAGLITLIRPTNIIVLLIIPLYGIFSLKDYQNRFLRLLRLWPHILIMAGCFILVWVPQFLYWHKVSGSLFYFSYGEVGSAFYFNNPQILSVLFSYKKGWFVYTPIMLLATLSIIILFRQKSKFAWVVVVYFLVNLYILSSWWSWWFGGGFSNRAFVDSYGLMALPLAALFNIVRQKKYLKIFLPVLILILTAYNQLQTQQYRYAAVHYWWMNKEAYWENFLKVRTTCKYWFVLNQPDVLKARQGVYEAVPFVDNHISREDLFKRIDSELNTKANVIDSLKNKANELETSFDSLKAVYINRYIDEGKAQEEYRELRLDFMRNILLKCKSWKKDISRMAKRKNISFEEAVELDLNRIYDTYSQKYIK